MSEYYIMPSHVLQNVFLREKHVYSADLLNSAHNGFSDKVFLLHLLYYFKLYFSTTQGEHHLPADAFSWQNAGRICHSLHYAILLDIYPWHIQWFIIFILQISQPAITGLQDPWGHFYTLKTQQKARLVVGPR